MLTVANIRKRVKQIDEISFDPEDAHSKEDELYVEVLATIADGAENPQQLAKAALKANELTFTRWYA